MNCIGPAEPGRIVVQRLGGALNLNVHLHALVLDGPFARGSDGRLSFHRALAPTPADVAVAIMDCINAAAKVVDSRGGGVTASGY